MSGTDPVRTGAVLKILLLAVLMLSPQLRPAEAMARRKPVVPVVAAPEAPTPALLAAIDAALADHRLDSAREIISRSRSRYAGTELQLREAELALASSDMAGAAAGFADIVAEPVAAARAQQGLGIARLLQGDLAAATTAIDAALALDPALVRAWNARGVIADRRRDWRQADEAYGRALAIDPQSAAVLTNRGYSQLLRGNNSEAEADLARAVAIEPGLTTARTNLRFARAMQGRYADAFAGSSRKDLAADLNTVGFAAMSRGDYTTAETYFKRALAINKRFDRTAWNNLLYLKARNGSAPDPDAAAVGIDR